MCKFLIIAVLCFLSLYVIPARATICWINLHDDLRAKHPLLLQNSVNDFLYPTKSHLTDIKLNFCESVRIACPQDKITVYSTKTNFSEDTLKCYGITLFHLVDARISAPLNRISCSEVPRAEASSTNVSCPNGTISNIGFKLENSVFLPTIDEICYNETRGETHWAHSKLVTSIRRRESELEVSAFSTGPFYKNITINPFVFTKQNQRERLLELLGNDTLVNAYIPSDGVDFLVEGALVPKADMFYRVQQSSTFFYINTVPVWKSIRDRNWHLVEQIVQKLVLRQNSDLDVWTGGIDNLALNDENGTLTEITLTTNRDGIGAVPVPRFLFKYVVNKRTNQGIAFVTLNNPRVNAVTVSDMICQPYDKCTELFPHFNIATEGYTYCCTIDSAGKFSSVAAKLGLPIFADAKPIL